MIEALGSPELNTSKPGEVECVTNPNEYHIHVLCKVAKQYGRPV